MKFVFIFIAIILSTFQSSIASPVIKIENNTITVTESGKTLYSLNFTAKQFDPIVRNDGTEEVQYQRIDNTFFLGKCLIVSDMKKTEYSRKGTILNVESFNLQGKEITHLKDQRFPIFPANAGISRSKILNKSGDWGIIELDDEGLISKVFLSNSNCEISYLKFPISIHGIIKIENHTNKINLFGYANERSYVMITITENGNIITKEIKSE